MAIVHAGHRPGGRCRGDALAVDPVRDLDAHLVHRGLGLPPDLVPVLADDGRVPEVADEHVRAALDANGACWGPYQSFRRMVETDPRCSTANPIFAEVDQPGIGRHLMPGSPVDYGAFARQPPAPAPQLGADTDEILSTVLGLNSHHIARLHDQRIVAGT